MYLTTIKKSNAEANQACSLPGPLLPLTLLPTQPEMPARLPTPISPRSVSPDAHASAFSGPWCLLSGQFRVRSLGGGQHPQLPFSAPSSGLALQARRAGLLPLCFWRHLFPPRSPSARSLGSCLDTGNSPSLLPGLSPRLQTSLWGCPRAPPAQQPQCPPALVRNGPRAPLQTLECEEPP